MIMDKKPLILFTKYLLDFMFYTGALVCLSVPWIFYLAGNYYKVMREFYIPYCIIFIVAGIFALIILKELRKIFKTILKETPFIRENVTSLNRMGGCAFVIATTMASRIIFVITPSALVLAAVFLIAGLFSFVLANVFDQAVTYKLENDLTI